MKGRVVDVDEDKIKSMYVDSKMSSEAIAKEMKVSTGLIYRTIKKLGVLRSKTEALNLNWQKPEFIQSVLEGLMKEPNEQELHVDAIIQRIFPGEFSYNGGHEERITIERKVPDWIHTNGRKLLVEYNGCFFHSCQQCGYEMMRNGRTAESIRQRDKRKLEVFRKHGFDTLVIWGHDSDEEVVEKLQAFMVGQLRG